MFQLQLLYNASTSSHGFEISSTCACERRFNYWRKEDMMGKQYRTFLGCNRKWWKACRCQSLIRFGVRGRWCSAQVSHQALQGTRRQWAVDWQCQILTPCNARPIANHVLDKDIVKLWSACGISGRQARCIVEGESNSICDIFHPYMAIHDILRRT